MIQKYYLSFPDSGEHGAVYLWESADALRAFSGSDLARTIPDAYQVDGDPQVEIADVALVLHDGAARPEQPATA